MSVVIIIVTHNSQDFLPHCLDSLPSSISECIIADSGSKDTAYIENLQKKYNLPITVLYCENIGFAAANNRAYAEYLQDAGNDDLCIFLNPDAFLENDSIAQLVNVMKQNPRVGIIGARLLGCQIEDGKPQKTGKLDSTGIFRHWYGRWYDRSQGETNRGQHAQNEKPPALCGAFMACRMQLLQELWNENGTIFAPEFFLYKEDIEISLRTRKKGWQLLYAPDVKVWHCRGWQQDRQKMPYRLRLLAAKNEIRLYCIYPSPYIVWAVVKYILVRFCRL